MAQSTYLAFSESCLVSIMTRILTNAVITAITEPTILEEQPTSQVVKKYMKIEAFHYTQQVAGEYS